MIIAIQIDSVNCVVNAKVKFSRHGVVSHCSQTFSTICNCAHLGSLQRIRLQAFTVSSKVDARFGFWNYNVGILNGERANICGQYIRAIKLDEACSIAVKFN